MKRIICMFLIVFFLSSCCLSDMRYGQLNVLSRYGRHKIFLDGEDVGETPVKLDKVIAGSHLLRALDSNSLEKIFDKSIIVKDGELTTIVVGSEEQSPSSLQTPTPARQSSGDATLNLSRYNSEKKDLGIAAALSFLIIGGGQVYNGNLGKAAIQWIISIISYAGMYNSVYSSGASSGQLYAIIYLGNWIYGIFDAYTESDEINNKLKLKYGITSVQLLDLSSIPSF